MNEVIVSLGILASCFSVKIEEVVTKGNAIGVRATVKLEKPITECTKKNYALPADATLVDANGNELDKSIVNLTTVGRKTEIRFVGENLPKDFKKPLTLELKP